jgi:hypothetical protein
MLAIVQALVRRLYDWLACADSVADGDLIFPVAGRQSRKMFALELFSQGRAPKLLLSVARFEIRRFAKLPLPVSLDLLSIAASIPAPVRHFFVSLEAGKSAVEFVRLRGRFGTLREIQALATWLRDHPNINSVLVVSSASHLRRVRMCCRAFLPRRLQFRMLADPNENPLEWDQWWRRREARVMVLAEPFKLLLYLIVLPFERVFDRRSALRKYRTAKIL